MQNKWVIGAAVSTLSIGVIGVSAAFAATSAHLSDQSGVTISAGVEGESLTPIAQPLDSIQRTGEAGSSDSKNQSTGDDKPTQHSNQQTQKQQQQPPVQTQQPQPEQPVVAPPPQPQSVSSVSVASVESFD